MYCIVCLGYIYLYHVHIYIYICNDKSCKRVYLVYNTLQQVRSKITMMARGHLICITMGRFNVAMIHGH